MIRGDAGFEPLVSARSYMLAIDLGTGGPKVALIGDDGRIAASAVRSVRTQLLPDSGAEQDPDEIWEAIIAGAQQVIGSAGVPRESIVGVTCDSQYFSVLPIDASGKPVGKLILWLDGRGGPHTLEIYRAHPDAFLRWVEIAGMPALPTGSDSLSHMLFIQKERPEIYERAYKLVEPADYVTTRFSGVCASNACTAFAQLLTDNRKLASVEYSDELLTLSGIDREKLPDLVPINSCIGRIRPQIAASIGLAPETRIFAGVNDTHAVSIGSGTFRTGRGGINIGTTGQVLAFAGEMKADLENSILSMPSPIRERYMVMAENGLAGKTLEHFLHNLVFVGDPLADQPTSDPYAGVEETLRSVVPGSEGVLYLPWLSGSQSPTSNAKMRGGFLNLSLETTRAHLLRAVIEGVTLSLRWLLPAVERFCGEDFASLTFSGGAAQSAEWSQLVADVMGRPVHQLADPRHVNNRATALLAFETLGTASLDRIDKLCPIERSYEPRRKQVDLYAQRLEQLQAAYRQLRPLFEAMNA